MELPRKRPGRRPGEHKEFPYQKLVRMRRDDVDRVERITRLGGFESEAEAVRAAIDRLNAYLDTVEAAAEQLEGVDALEAWSEACHRLMLHRQGAFRPLLEKTINEERIRETDQQFPATPEEYQDYDWVRALATRLRYLGLPLR